MFKDTKEELERIQQELLEEQATQRFEPVHEGQEKSEIDGLLEDAELEALLRETTQAPKRSVVYKNYSNNYGKDVRNFANGYGDQREAPEEEPEAAEEIDKTPADSGLRGPLITAGILLGGILLVLLWWIVQYGGLL